MYRQERTGKVRRETAMVGLPVSHGMNPVGMAAILVTLGGPLLLGVTGLCAKRYAVPAGAPPPSPWDWRLAVGSALLYALSFSLIFFIQELFLVVPKALTADLRPTLFHNNHHWEGENPLAALFQGTGALAIFLTATLFALWLKLRPPHSTPLRLFAIWMAFHGFFESLPQVVVGAIFPGNDVGMAMDYLGLTPAAKSVAALIALAAIAAVAVGFIRPLLALAREPGDLAGAGRRTRFIFLTATLPALAALPLILLFRVPGSIDQVVIVPVAVTVIGISWIQAGAWRVTSARAGTVAPIRSVRLPLAATALLLLIFQLILRPGIAFY